MQQGGLLYSYQLLRVLVGCPAGWQITSASRLFVALVNRTGKGLAAGARPPSRRILREILPRGILPILLTAFTHDESIVNLADALAGVDVVGRPPTGDGGGNAVYSSSCHGGVLLQMNWPLVIQSIKTDACQDPSFGITRAVALSSANSTSRHSSFPE